MPITRDQVPASRKWNLELMISGEAELEQLFADVKSALPGFAKYNKKLNADSAIECFRELSATARKAERLYVYSFMKCDENTADTKYQALSSRMEMLIAEFSTATSFIIPQLSRLPEKTLREMIGRTEYADYTNTLQEIIREKKHMLSDKEEKLMSELSTFMGDFENVFTRLDNADLRFEDVTVDGNPVKLTHGMYAVLLQNPEQSVRKEAFEKYYKAYISLKNTFAASYAGNVKKNCATAKVRKYKSALGRALFAEGITDKVYNNLIKAVRKGTPAVHQYVALRKKALGLKELHMYDMYVPLTKAYELSLDYDEAYKLVIDALAPLGEKYRAILEEAYRSNWIDVEETENKRSGAYHWGVYDAPPFVLLNYQRTAHDVFTIAHEIGHAIHSYDSKHTQCYNKADYAIFVAEVASTVNEVLLLKHLLKTAEGEQRKFLLSYYLDMFRTTLFRQTMFAEFEKFAHVQIEAGIPLTHESLSTHYIELNKKYYGKALVHDDQIAYEWSRIPHFYKSSAFYVYKYSTGLTSAVNIASKILADSSFVDQYFRFLSSGSSMLPLEILKLVDIDLSTPAPFDFAMNEFAVTLQELKKLL